MRYLPKIIQFLGDDPFAPPQTLGEMLAAIRRQHGLSLDLMACYLDVDPGSLSAWERGEPIHFRCLKHRIELFLEDYAQDGRQVKILAGLLAS